MDTLTLTLTEEEAGRLHDLVGWAGDTIGEMLVDAKTVYHGERSENDEEIITTYEPLADICLRVGALIEAEDGAKPAPMTITEYRDRSDMTEAELAEADALPTKTIPQFPPPGVPHDENEEERYRNHGPTDLQDHLSSFSVETLAYEFVKVINEDMTREQVVEVDALNATEPDEWKDKICHSHDFCDANMSMLEAWGRVVNTVDGEQLEDGDDGYVDMDCQDRDIAYLVNCAWTMAKAKGFSCPDFYHPNNN